MIINEKINTDLKTLKFIFNKNRYLIVPISVILVSILLFFTVVIQQFNMLIFTQKQAQQAAVKLKNLKANMDVIKNTDEILITSQLNTVSSALPLTKDFIGILNSVYYNAEKTGVSLGSFSFKVGDISGSDAEKNVPSVKLSIPVNSDIAGVKSFVENISNTFPLSEINLVRVGEVSSTVDVLFYYQPLGASNYSQDAKISPVSQKGLDLIKSLTDSEVDASLATPVVPTATSSAQ